jgi:hypothetical protein
MRITIKKDIIDLKPPATSTKIRVQADLVSV